MARPVRRTMYGPRPMAGHHAARAIPPDAATRRGPPVRGRPRTDADAADGLEALRRLIAEYPDAVDVVLHPADIAYFVDVCKMAGKPVPFVPVIDADVRRWWRSDSLWQAHDDRYGADEVCVIPG